MERFFILDKFNTWYNWDLILTDKDVTPPEPKTNYVELDGMSGTLDLSESLTGEVVYKDRTLTASFWTDTGTFNSRKKLLLDIVTALHGKKIKIIEPDDPDHYFLGRVKIKSQKNTLPYAELSIEATCEPWRYAINAIERRVSATGDITNIVIHNRGVKTLSPTITVDGTVNITCDGITTALTTGSYIITSVKLAQGANVIGVSGSGSVTFTYREASL